MSVNLKIPIVKTNSLFSQKEFDEIREYFSKITGNKLGSEKISLVESRLRKRLIETNLDIFDYIKLIKNNKEECSKFVSSLTTHKTDWFRENVHFNFLKKKIADRKKLADVKDLLIWSAASSTGEEVYSLLMTCLESGENRCKILGTDISEACVNEGKNGVYLKSKVADQVRPDLVNKYFLKRIGEKHGDYLQFSTQYNHHLKWNTFNLMNSDLKLKVHFDFIFVRNVLIYFDPQNCKKIIHRLTDYMKPGGYIIVGLSETIFNYEQLGLKLIENSVYQKI